MRSTRPTHDVGSGPLVVDLVSEHASPLAAIGGVDAGGQNVHVAALAAGLIVALTQARRSPAGRVW